jgi:hypothetical protein
MLASTFNPLQFVSPTKAADPEETASITEMAPRWNHLAPVPLPAPRPDGPPSITIKVPANVRIISGSMFRVGSDVYRLTDPETLTRDPCKRGTPGCIRHPMRYLRLALQGATLRCERADGAFNVLTSCVRQPRAEGRRVADLY